MNGGITIDDFDIIFKTSEDSLNGEDDNLGGIVLEGYEVGDSLSMCESMRRFYYKITINYLNLTK